jgi:REP element-mobilizing transposase RayT
MTQLILYALALAAERHGIQVHSLCALSTHMHMVVTDPNCSLPCFLRDFHQWVAFGTKIMRQWEGAVWDNERTSVVRLLTEEAIVEKIAYILANPVAAGLVRHAHQWPGAKTRVRDIGEGKLRVTRPAVYFDERNPLWKAKAEIPIKLPPMIAEEDAEKFRRIVAKQLANEEENARRHVCLETIIGAKAATEMSPYAQAQSTEPPRKRKPTFAVGPNNGDALKRAVAEVRSFRTSYRAALDNWRRGVRDVLFPMGTWWMRVFHGANVNRYSGSPHLQEKGIKLSHREKSVSTALSCAQDV